MTKLDKLLVKEVVGLLAALFPDTSIRRLVHIYKIWQMEKAAQEKGLAFKWSGRLP